MTSINRQPADAPHAAPRTPAQKLLDRLVPAPHYARIGPDGCRTRRFSPNEVIYRESDQGGRVFLIRHGLAKVLIYLPNGQTRIIRLHNRGHWIGLERLMDHPCRHTAIAIGEVQADVFPAASLEEIHREDPGTLGQILRQWHIDLAQADKWISEFSTGDIKSRVARLLMYLAELEHGPGARIVELLTVNEMAEILGVTQESVSRILAAFKRRGVLHKDGGRRPGSFRLDIDQLLRESAA